MEEEEGRSSASWMADGCTGGGSVTLLCCGKLHPAVTHAAVEPSVHLQVLTLTCTETPQVSAAHHTHARRHVIIIQDSPLVFLSRTSR